MLVRLWPRSQAYVDARARGGKWLVRIEDLDTPRNALGAVDIDFRTSFRALGMTWDEDIVFQSRRMYTSISRLLTPFFH
jgi:glutamyl/glutaminyl-tRNA synthetase